MMNKQEMDRRIKALAEELGLTVVEQELFDQDGKPLGNGFSLRSDELEQLDAMQTARLEQLRFELTAEANGTTVVFETVALEPDDVRINPDDPANEELRVTLACPAQDLRRVFLLAQVASELVPLVMQEGFEQIPPDLWQRLRDSVHEQLQGPEGFALDAHKTEELGLFLHRTYNSWRTEQGIEALQDVTTIDDLWQEGEA